MSIFTDIYKDQKETLQKLSQVNNITANIYYNTIYENMTINTFEWSNTNEKFRKQWIEILLYYCPICAGFDKGNNEIIVLPCSASGKILENGLYSEYLMYAPNGKTYRKPLEDIELLFNNTICVSTYLIQKPIIDGLLDTFTSIKQNIKRAKVGSIIATNDSGSIKTIMDAVNNAVTLDDLVKVVQNESFGEGIKQIPIFDNRMTDIQGLWESHSQFKSMIQTDLGFASIDVFKRERLTERESKAGQESAQRGLVDDMLNNRQDFCERLNKHFGTNYKCELRRNYDDLEEENNNVEESMEEGENDGE